MVKKTLFLVALFLLTPTAFVFADTVSVNHDTAYAGPNGNSAVGASPLDIASCSITTAGDVSVFIEDSQGYAQQELSTCTGVSSAFYERFVSQVSYNVLTDPQPYDYSFIPDTYKLLIVDNTNPDVAPSVDSVTGDPGILYATPLLTVLNEEAPISQTPSNGISSLIADGETAYQTTTGTSLGASVGWAGDNLIKPWVGSGLALLAGLAGWLAALAVISGIVFFAFRALNKGLNEINNRRIVSGIRDSDKITGTYDGKSRMIYDSRGHKFKKPVTKPAAQKAGGYQAYKLRQALKKGKYKDSKVHSAFGKNWT